MISVAMIGRDEANCIKRALQSVRPFAAEIIFIDTGSVDGTADIAAEFGAKVIGFEWQYDFSAARNFAIRQCTSDWILSIDCDEELLPTSSTGSFLQHLGSQDDCVGYQVLINNRLSDGKIDSHSDVRLFRNLERIVYENPIHESVTRSIYELYPSSLLKTADFVIDHHGYSVGERNKKKISRNLEILARWTDRAPDNPYAWYKLGLSLKSTSSEHATACLFRSFEILLSRPDRNSFAFRFELIQQLTSSLEKQGTPLLKLVESESAKAFS